ncbi:AIG protein [Biomphalaria pfeifferi]|uniref:AIG protein n=1 Tax=Biomphalaria pfeifferi TaxID=112525 RepID=A0AAD8B2D6_BIOPF|nr:AIG protein [Biomphalaria pfeifferi]
MRPVKELADVVIKLEVLEDIVEQLQGIIADIQSVIKKCSTWVDETDTSTYEDIKPMLVTKTCYFIQTLFQMALERNSKLSESVITEEEMKNVSEIQTMEDAGLGIKETFDYQKLEEKLKDISTNVESYKDMVEILQQKNKVIEKNFKKISKQNKANGTICAEHYQEIMEELSVASRFMSNLKDEKINLSTELTEHNKKMENVSEKVNKTIEIVSEFAMNLHLQDEYKKQNLKLIDDCAKLQVTLEIKEAENRRLMDEIGLLPKDFLEKFKRSLKDAYASGINFLLVGPSGHGKSAVGNSILQKQCFQSTLSTEHVNKTMQRGVGKYNDLSLRVFDLPGFCLENNQQSREIYPISCQYKLLVRYSENICVILVVVKFGYDITQEVINFLDSIKSKTNQNIFKDYGILLMTRGDIFKQNTEEAMPFQDWLQRQGCLKELLTEFNGRALLFDNISKDADVQKRQLDDLKSMIDKMILLKTFVSNP